MLPGSVAFQLHDTFGFPLDLTQVIGREQGFAVDETGFQEEMKKQRERSKFQGSGDQAVGASYHAVRTEKGATKFVGYLHGSEGEQTKARVLALLVDGERVTRAAEGQEVDVITDQTPFYARSGGQVGDTGKILGDDTAGEVLDTLKPIGDLHVHKVRLTQGHLDEGAEVTLRVEGSRRDLTRKNHSATHLLHHALRSVLGEHVTQKGSYVGPDKLTFDFSHFSPLSEDERRKVERLVNEAVQKNAEARAEEMGFDDAQRQGAMALFGEKYGDRVRVLAMGGSVELWRVGTDWKAVWAAEVRGRRPWTRQADPDFSDSGG